MSESVVLKFRGTHVCSFKNSKMIVKRKGHYSLITKPEYRKLMDEITRSFASQLHSAFLTTKGGTPMAPSTPSLIVSSPQCEKFDDSRQWIPEITVRCIEVDKGEEGADVEITLLGHGA